MVLPELVLAALDQSSTLSGGGRTVVVVPIQRKPSTQLHPPRTKLHISIAIEAARLNAKVLQRHLVSTSPQHIPPT